jgi:trehalose 6-phosphate phosphatase
MNPGPSADAATPPRAAPLRLDRTSLFLDIDGTIAPIVARPDQVGPNTRRTALMRALGERLAGRLAVVSGRAISDVDRILEGAVTAVAGVHGLERRAANGRTLKAAPHPALAEALSALERMTADQPGVMIENKGLSFAVHYRGAPLAGPEIDGRVRGLAHDLGLAVQPGAQVIELRTPGHDKGDAIRAFMAEAPFAGGRPVFVGDDLTDEPAFEVVSEMGGFGLLVGPPRPTHASGRLANPEAVLAWLDQAILADAS